jgi:hypothetical protein
VNAFALPATPGVFGNCGRSVIKGPAVHVLHAGMFKTFTVAERYRFRLGTQVTNVLNHPNWSNLSSNALRLDNSARAVITGAGGATSGSAGDASGPREVRLDLRVEF